MLQQLTLSSDSPFNQDHLPLQHVHVRLEHTLEKAKLQLQKHIDSHSDTSKNQSISLTSDSIISLEFAYLLKSQREFIIKYFCDSFLPEKHGNIQSLRIMNSNLSSSDAVFLFQTHANLFQNLNYLSFQSNTSFPMQSLSVVFEASSQLVSLDLRNNTQINDSIITYIDKLPQLAILNLSNTSISDTFISSLSKNTSLTQSIQELNISRNFRIITLEGFITFPNDSKLEKLDISYCDIFPIGFENLKKSLIFNQLKSLDISCNTLLKTTKEQMKDLFVLGPRNTENPALRICELHLNNLYLTVQQLGCLLNGENNTSNLPSLQILDLQDNLSLFKEDSSSDTATNSSLLLKKCESTFSQLKSINLRNSGLTVSSLKTILPWLKQIAHIDLSYNPLVKNSESESSSSNTNETKSDLKEEPKILPCSISEIFVLPETSRVTSLGLGGLGLTAGQLEWILKENEKQLNSSLQNLYLRENPGIADKAVEGLLGKQGKDMFQLRYLNLSATNLTDEGFKILLSAKHSELIDLRLSENNDLSYDSVMGILDTSVQQQNLCKLKRLSLGSLLDNPKQQELERFSFVLCPFFGDALD